MANGQSTEQARTNQWLKAMAKGQTNKSKSMAEGHG
jgi:hypothetical protein